MRELVGGVAAAVVSMRTSKSCPRNHFRYNSLTVPV